MTFSSSYFFLKSCLKIGGAAYTRLQLIHESLRYTWHISLYQPNSNWLFCQTQTENSPVAVWNISGISVISANVLLVGVYKLRCDLCSIGTAAFMLKEVLSLCCSTLLFWHHVERCRHFRHEPRYVSIMQPLNINQSPPEVAYIVAGRRSWDPTRMLSIKILLCMGQFTELFYMPSCGAQYFSHDVWRIVYMQPSN